MSKLAEDIIVLRQAERIPGAEIARRLGCTEARASQVLNAAGLGRGPAAPRPARKPRADEHINKFCSTGANLKDPNRADKLLRRFSWQEQEA